MSTNLGHNYCNDTESSSPDPSSEEEELETLDAAGDGRRRRDGKLWDPRARWVQEWNRIFLLVCAVGLFVDPLFFYSLSISHSCMCLYVDGWFAVTVTVLRCMTDALHLWNVWLQFKINRRTHDSPRTVACSYFKSKRGFFFDLFVILPLPQVRLLISPS